MDSTVFTGLNKIRTTHKLTFNERKFLETAICRSLIEEVPFTNNLDILNEKRVARGDMRHIDTGRLYAQASALLQTAVARG